MGSKYIVFKQEEFDRWANGLGERDMERMPLGLPDAVVIRRQDVFAPPALDAYANAIQVVIETLCNGAKPSGRTEQLQAIADYFHDQAAKSWTEQRKLPD
jgi:hypothetical protein